MHGALRVGDGAHVTIDGGTFSAPSGLDAASAIAMTSREVTVGNATFTGRAIFGPQVRFTDRGGNRGLTQAH